MKRRQLVSLIFILFVFTLTAKAQQIPFLNEFLQQNELFNKTYIEKQRTGKTFPRIEELRVRIEQLSRRGNIPGMLELISEGMAILENRLWDERAKFLASLTLHTNCLVLEANAELRGSLVQVFPADVTKAFSTAPTVTFELRAANTNTKFKPLMLGSNIAFTTKSTTASQHLKIADGEYIVVAVLFTNGEKIGEVKTSVFAVGEFANRIAAAKQMLETIKNSSDAKVKAVVEQITTPEFWVQRISAYTSSVGEEPTNPIVEMQRIEQALAAFSKGRNPFSTERGELERAYLASDSKLVPYRIYVPKSYNDKKAHPLVVMLHGSPGDEKSYFSNHYDEKTIKGEAEKRGWIFVAPNGRGRFSGYRGLGGDDVFEVIKRVKRDYKTDKSRIYLTGHSMGGGGTWSVASAKPEIFAAISPVAGTVRTQGEALTKLFDAVRPLPILIVQGTKDDTVPPQVSRDLYAAAQKAGLNVRYLELPEADHITIVVATIVEVLNFFEKQVKQNRAAVK